MVQAAESVIKNSQLNLFQDDELKIDLNKIKDVRSVDLYDVVYPTTFKTLGKETEGMVHLKEYCHKGDYTMYSTGGWHYFKDVFVYRDNIPAYFAKPVFPCIYSHRINKFLAINVPQSKNPYPYVSLTRTNKKVYVHKMVAAAFVERPDDDKNIVVHHKNDIKWDYRPSNLEWTTHSRNSVGTSNERKLNILQRYDSLFQEMIQGRNYNIKDYENEESDS